MRLFLSYKGSRVPIDITNEQTVKELLEYTRAYYRIPTDYGHPEGKENKHLTLSHAGADLDPAWILNDLGLQPGSTLRAYNKEIVKPVLYFYSVYNGKEIPLLQKLSLNTLSVGVLRVIVSRKTGLPVVVFRMLDPSDQEMFDCQTLDMYDIKEGDTIKVETWDGWNEFLQSCVLGFTQQVMSQLSPDEVEARYQMKVAMYLAAHFGNIDLAVHLIRQGIRPEEHVGDHPTRQWCRNVSHIDSLKTPIHETAEMGQLGVLRSFVHHNVCTCLARDGNDLTPLNLALRNQQRHCASFLLTKQWSRISYHNNKSLSLAIFVKMKRWSFKAKEKVLIFNGQFKSSVKHPRRFLAPGALVGHGVQLDGFTQSKLNTKTRVVVKTEEERKKEKERRRKRLYEYPQQRPDVEGYFKQSQAAIRLPKVTRYQKLTTKANQAPSVANQAPSVNQTIKPDNEENKSLHNDSPDASSSLAHKNYRPRSRSGGDAETLKLPPIKAKLGRGNSHQNLTVSDTTEDTAKLNVSKDGKGVYVQTGKNKTPSPNKLSSSYDAEMEDRIHQRNNPLSKSMPTNSLNTPRKIEDIAKETLETFQRYRGSTSKEYALKCLSVAKNFKELPWLRQVRVAMTIGARGVKKAVANEPHLISESGPQETTSIESRTTEISSIN